MSQTESIYNELAAKHAATKANKKVISEYSSLLYKDALPYLTADMTEEQFAAFTSNYNVGKAGIGQKAQIQILAQTNHPTISLLSNKGPNSIKLWKTTRGLSIKKGAKASAGITAITGIKSFDAIEELPNKVTLFFLKTVDIGKYSNNTGGGHQDNVRDEIAILINTVKNKTLSYNGKQVEFAIFVDGRSADNIILYCQGLLHDAVNITIGKCDNL